MHGDGLRAAAWASAYPRDELRAALLRLGVSARGSAKSAMVGLGSPSIIGQIWHGDQKKV
jgi:hypothetical protein